MKPFAYHSPRSKDELWELLGRLPQPGMRFLAGGTDLIPALDRGATAAAALVDLKRIPQLSGIYGIDHGELRIGALTPLRALAECPSVEEHYPALSLAAGRVASHQIRNRGTVGGNLCLDTRCPYYNQPAFWRLEYPDCRKRGGAGCYVYPRGDRCYALASCDLAAPLIAQGARVEIGSPHGSREIPLEDLYADSGLEATTLGPLDVLLSVGLPIPSQSRAAFRRYAPRDSIDFPTFTLAIAMGADWARLVIGGVASKPLLSVHALEQLRAWRDRGGATPAEIAETLVDELELKSSVRGAVSYKKHVIRSVVEGMIEDFLDPRGGG